MNRKRVLIAVAKLALVALTVVYIGRRIELSDRFEDPACPTCRIARAPDGVFTIARDGAPARVLGPDEVARLRTVPGAGSVLRGLSLKLVPFAFGLNCFGLMLVALRWQRLLRLFGAAPRFTSCWRVVMLSQSASILLPGAVGGDMARVAGATAFGVSWPRATVSVLLDRLVGMWVMCLVTGAIAGLWGSRVLRGPALLLFAGAAVAIPIAHLAIRLGQRLPARVRRIMQLDVLAGVLFAGARSPRTLTVALAASAGNFLCQSGCFMVLLYATWQRPFEWAGGLTAVALTFVVSALPLTPGGFGVGEAAFVYLLGLHGIPAAAVLAACLANRLVLWTVGAASLPLLWLGRPLSLRAKPVPEQLARGTEAAGQVEQVDESGRSSVSAGGR